MSKISTDDCINALISVMKNEVGYLEKRSNSNLDSKTANAGSANFTKYWLLYPAFQGSAWCAMFITWCFVQCFGKDKTTELLKHYPYVYCPTLAAKTSSKTPKKGSIIIFYNGKTYSHTGFVTDVTSSKVYTIEGNTSSGSSVISNGGAVCSKSYYRSNMNANNKYFMPDYSLVSSILTGATVTTTTVTQTAPTVASASSSSSSGSTTTTKANTTLNCTCSIKGVQNYLNSNYATEIKANCGGLLDVDGEVGKLTKKALACAFQKELNAKGASLDIDGDFGAKSQTAFDKYAGTLKNGSKSIFVTLWQELLVCFGYTPSDKCIDGEFGENTVTATNKLFKKYSLTQDGKVSGADVNKLI